MSNVLLIEPDYRSKFPPLGLLRLATYHRDRGDSVTFARGKVPALRSGSWHRVYVSSLFTWELPRTVRTIKYYESAVENPHRDILVGGIAATLMPEYITSRANCRVIAGPLDRVGMLGKGTPRIADYVPDYNVIDAAEWAYLPKNSYFCRVSKGCIRHCKFCAVPKLEPTFGFRQSLRTQIEAVDKRFGERQNLVLFDNNILALDSIKDVLGQIRDAGFGSGARRNKRFRSVDFNQGIDARLIDADMAKQLATICLSPVRLAFDHDGVEQAYRRAIKHLANVGFEEFTNYVMFNFHDDPAGFYRRLKINVEMSAELGVRVTGFPMRFIPIDDVTRRYVSSKWTWRYLRGIQCVLLATHGVVSPNPVFFKAAFGRSLDEFLEIVSMPDLYIIQRKKYSSEAKAWRNKFRGLTASARRDFLQALETVHRAADKKEEIARSHCQFHALFEHYYPNGKIAKEEADSNSATL